MDLKTNSYLDEKSALLYIIDPDEGNIHISWEADGIILFFEHCPLNHPSSAIVIKESLDDYLDVIRNVNWINLYNIKRIDHRFDFKDALELEVRHVNK